MQQAQQDVEEAQRGLERGAVDGLLVGWLHDLEIPC